MGSLGPRHFAHAPAALWRLTLLVLVSGQLVTCAGPPAEARQPDVGQSPAIHLAWASTHYAPHEPTDAVVQLDVIVRNGTEHTTRSTSIEWEPVFAAAYEVLESDPPAWRIHIRDDGWGVLDTSGVLPGQDGAFRVWFSATDRPTPLDEDTGPLIRVVVDGQLPAGEGAATPTHAAERHKLSAQQLFERGHLAAAADRLTLLPAGGVGAHPVVVTLATVWLAITALGFAAAYQVTRRPPARAG